MASRVALAPPLCQVMLATPLCHVSQGALVQELYLHVRRELYTDKNTFRAITLLICELQSSRSVNLDQRDEIYQMSLSRTYRELLQVFGFPDGSGMQHGCTVTGFVFFRVAPSGLHPKARKKHGWRSRHMDVHPRIRLAF